MAKANTDSTFPNFKDDLPSPQDLGIKSTPKKKPSFLDIFNKFAKDQTVNDLPPQKLPKEYTSEQVVIINKTKRTYLFMGIASLLLIAIDIFAVVNHNVIFIVISAIISVIYFLIQGIILLIRIIFFGDISRLRNKIVMTFSDYIMCHFHMTNRRKLSKPLVLNSDGKSISYGDGDYVVDEDCIEIDSAGIPHIDYIYGIPNPLKYDKEKYLNEYFKNIREGHPEKNIQLQMDVRYSAKNLRLLKNDKILEEMHRDKSGEIGRLVLFMFLEALIFCFLIFVIVIVMSKNPQVTVMMNTTTSKG